MDTKTIRLPRTRAASCEPWRVPASSWDLFGLQPSTADYLCEMEGQCFMSSPFVRYVDVG